MSNPFRQAHALVSDPGTRLGEFNCRFFFAPVALLCGHSSFRLRLRCVRPIADYEAGRTEPLAKLSANHLSGCSKRFRGEAREKSILRLGSGQTGGVHRQYVDARRLSARFDDAQGNRHVGLIRQPDEGQLLLSLIRYWPMRLANSAGEAMAKDTGIINALMITSPQMAAE